jgi:hypothetical protein
MPSGGRDLLAVAALAFAVSLVSLSYYFQRSEILLYGDAVAHINIARRVFDSHTPGLWQLGTVWLPLPHLLMIPFLLSDGMWQTGIGGSIPSVIAYVVGAVGVFRLTRGIVTADADVDFMAKLGPWVAALVYVANPNLIYLQTTAMTEPLHLAFFVWAVVYLVECVQIDKERTTITKGTPRLRSGQPPEHEGEQAALWKCALCVAGAELTRYDGWFLGTVMGIAILFMAIRRWNDRRLRWAALKFILAVAIAPAVWLAYNAAVYGNPLEFANGPYSAKAIEQRAATPGMPSHPGGGNVVLAARYFLKSAELNMASGNWGRIWIAISVAGVIAVLLRIRVSWPVLLLWIPFPFYAVSIAYGGVPLFLPGWWPFTLYNARYGIQLLPLFAVSSGLIVTLLGPGSAPPAAPQADRISPSRKRSPDTDLMALVANFRESASRIRLLAFCAIILIATLSYFWVWKAQPLCFTEASVNSRTKLALESAVARTIRQLPRDSEYLMYLGDHVGAFEQAGIPLRHVINEGNHRPWKRPSDPDGLWEQALAEPTHYADFVIAFDGDAVDRAVNKGPLTLLTVVHTGGQPEARIYAARAGMNRPR